jgi:hypothetical protein
MHLTTVDTGARTRRSTKSDDGTVVAVSGSMGASSSQAKVSSVTPRFTSPASPPRPTPRSSPPPPASRTILRARQAYDATPPTIRSRAPSAVELDDNDIVESKPKSGSPPPPPSLRDAVPVLSVKLEQLARARTTWEAAGVCASALLRTLSARAVLVHQHDSVRGELRIIGAHGPAAQDLLGGIESVSDCVFMSAAVTNGKSVHAELDGLSARLVAHRHALLKATSIDVIPVVVDGRCVAVIEVVDIPPAWRPSAPRAMAFAAERFGAASGEPARRTG